MAKPATLPRWATSGTAQIVEPAEGKKDVGWQPSERPPAQYENWARKLVYDWIVYLDAITNEALTWASLHTFNAGLRSSVAPTTGPDVVRKTELDAEASTRSTADGLRPLDTAVVHNTGAEAVAGVKTFSSSPVIPTPAAAGDAANKGYADARETAARAYTDGKFPAVAWTNLTLNGTNWTNGTGDFVVAARMDASSNVKVRGKPIVGATPSVTLATLPIGMWPKDTRQCGIVNYTTQTVVPVMIMATGEIRFFTAPTTGHVYYLDGITFVGEQ